MRLEPQFYEALKAIAKEAGKTPSQICDNVLILNPDCPLTTAVRVFILEYYMWKVESK